MLLFASMKQYFRDSSLYQFQDMVDNVVVCLYETIFQRFIIISVSGHAYLATEESKSSGVEG